MNQQHMHKFEIVFYSPDRSWVSVMDGLIPENRYIATNDHMGHRFVTIFCERSEADLVRMSVEKFIDRLSQMINQDVTVFESIGWGLVYGKNDSIIRD